MERLVLAIVMLVSLVLVLTAIFNNKLPVWFCHKMGWHLAPKKMGFDGCSFTGECPRCGKKVLQDSQGNWF